MQRFRQTPAATDFRLEHIVPPFRSATKPANMIDAVRIRATEVNVFFYGLFMDQALLTEKGISPSNATIGYVDGFALRIGERATLLRSAGARSHGVMMNISPDETRKLYADSSVADYVPEPVTVEFSDGSKAEATCYNLPADKISGTNKDYAQSLMEVAGRLGFPDSYLDQIRQAGMADGQTN